MTTNRKITLVDVSLRDGSHAVRHQFTSEQVGEVAAALANAKVPVFEVTHGDGLGGSSLQFGFSKEPELNWIRTAVEKAGESSVSVLLLPGVGTQEELRRAREVGASVVRVATHCTEADIAPQHIAMGKELGMTVCGFLMMSHMITSSDLVKQARILEDAGADVVYVVDSAGALLPDQVRDRVRALRESLTCEVGFHGHNNLGLGVANTLVAMEEGASWLDGSLCSLGAGAGNTQLEVLVAVLDRMGVETGVDLYAAMDAAEEVVKPLLPRPIVIDRDALVIGYAGVYSTFLLHARRAAEKFGVESRDILIELGRRKAVGGQEDQIIRVAYELAHQ
ncbi:4-hydroxy-2-oxovalerate aldolase [Effusibacillus lacus]|uniref:4-hydroxy-2-oxovalerate aldolase n=1 Tax=Effusibacillus lacus TaxID=1348429 RepID=A0A292YQT6_9BACL|nr:4-hydroxy-2-oxovalerate aldolase [Effusibacillus lacus]TCS76942.1 4-hydroxy 2-oxovalerate aldolase [Effusibacillus lacus]GAX91271.1 4-hydroxy-2-ketovalerate aldolase [Effusibacillus lacus]